jgi:2-methylisocitrate lyase-like PEP mutase family enzyme
VFLYANGCAPGRLADVLARSSGYAEAGADGLFVPGLTALRTVAELAGASPLPVNIMAGPGAPPVRELAAAGVRRVSVGTAITQAAYTVAGNAAAELFTTGTYAALEAALDFGTIDGLFARDPAAGHA